ncbi:hypothetical protein Peur_015213 [Populus x canadensis]
MKFSSLRWYKSSKIQALVHQSINSSSSKELTSDMKRYSHGQLKPRISKGSSKLLADTASISFNLKITEPLNPP